MPDCNIRNVDEGMMRRMKARSAAEGRTLREWVLAVVEAELGDEAPAGGQGFEREAKAAYAEEAAERSPELERLGRLFESEADEGMENNRVCPGCEGPLTECKGKWACRVCDRGWTEAELDLAMVRR